MEHIRLTYGQEEEDFFFEQIQRSQPYSINNHHHSTFEIYYLLSGQRRYFIKDRTYDVYAGDLVFIDRHDVHKTSDLGPPGHERIVMNFSEAFLTGGVQHPLVPPTIFEVFRGRGHLLRLRPDERNFVQSLLDKLSREIVRQEPGWNSYVRLLLVELLLYAARQMERNDAAAMESAHPVHKKVAEVVQHINGHYGEPLDLTTIADTFYMSPSYLSRSFRKVTGFTLMEYIHFTRIHAAQKLLCETGLKIIDVASAAGFENVGHFDRIFKRITKMTPKTYRHLNG